MKTFPTTILLLLFLISSLSISAEDEKLFPVDADSLHLRYMELFRIGASWLERGDYANSYHYLSRANELNEKKSTATEDEVKNCKSILSLSSAYMNRSYGRDFTKRHILSVEASWSAESTEPLSDFHATDNWCESHNAISVRVNFEHDVREIFSLLHTASFVNSPYSEYLYANGKELSSLRMTVRNFEYGLEPTIRLKHGLRLALSSKFFGTACQSVTYKQDSLDAYGDWRYKFDWRSSKERVSAESQSYWPSNGNNDGSFSKRFDDYLIADDGRLDSIRIEKNTEFSFSVGFSAGLIYKHHEFLFRTSFLNYWRYNAAQLQLWHVWYPKGTLDFYLRTGLSCLWRYSELENFENMTILSSNSDKIPVAEETVGLRLTRNFWIECSFLFGNIRGYDDFNSKVVYLLAEDTRFRASLVGIVPVSSSVDAYFAYRMLRTETTVVSSEGYSLCLGAIRSINHTISMGVRWKY